MATKSIFLSREKILDKFSERSLMTIEQITFIASNIRLLEADAHGPLTPLVCVKQDNYMLNNKIFL